MQSDISAGQVAGVEDWKALAVQSIKTVPLSLFPLPLSCSIALFLKNFPADILSPPHISVHHICLSVILPFFCSCMLWSLLLPVHSLPKWAQKGNQKAPGREEREDRVHLRPNKEQALIIYCPPQPLANHRPLQG